MLLLEWWLKQNLLEKLVLFFFISGKNCGELLGFGVVVQDL